MFLITCRKRYAALFLAVFLSCSCIMGSHQEAHALAIGGVAVTAGEVVAFLLAAFGIVAASAAVYENSDSIKAWGEEQLEEFKLYASGFATVTGKTAEELAADIDVWTALAIAGTLDKASYVYDLFKKWCETLPFDNDSAESSDPVYAEPFEDVYIYKNIDLYSESNGVAFRLDNCGADVYIFFGPSPYVYFVSTSEFTYTHFSKTHPSGIEHCSGLREFNGTSYHFSKTYLSSAGYPLISYKRNTSEAVNKYYPGYLLPAMIEIIYNNNLIFGSFAVVDSVSSKILARDKVLDNVDIIPADAIADVGVETVPIDWSKIRSVAGALSDVVEGTSTIDTVLNQVGVEVIDKTGAITVPVPPADTGEFTMEGLESLFPFCLPFDLVDFFQVLSAEPEAPHFQWPIRYMAPDGPKEYVVDIDLSPFDSVAAILRKMELLAFIVGLIMITREKMIRG